MLSIGLREFTRQKLGGIAAALERQLSAKISRGTLDAHWAELQRRLNGEKPWTTFMDLTLPPMSPAASKNEPHYAEILRHYDFAVWEAGGVGISFDILNPCNELNVSCHREDEITLEAFFEPFSARDRSGRGQVIIREVALLLARETDARIVYGGASTFTNDFYSGFGYASPRIPADSMPENYLWPLTVLRRDLAPNITGPRAAPFHLVQASDPKYLLLQVFPDFDNGLERIYRACAASLGLRCLWEIEYPSAPRPS